MGEAGVLERDKRPESIIVAGFTIANTVLVGGHWLFSLDLSFSD